MFQVPKTLNMLFSVQQVLRKHVLNKLNFQLSSIQAQNKKYRNMKRAPEKLSDLQI